MTRDRTRRQALSVLFALLAIATRAYAQEPKQMAITFDDLPFAYCGTLTLAEQREAVRRILTTLDKYDVKAAVFVIGHALTEDNRDLVQAVADAGHVVGNHSFSHRDLGTITADEYIRDVDKGSLAIQPWLKGPHYFRYPFLQQGNTEEKRDAVLKWLRSRDIVVAPVTIDNNDYLYNQRLVDAKAAGQTIDIREEYLNHMMEAAALYDAKSRAVLGRPVKHILLLHMNYVNSLYLDELLQRFRNNGWSFISFEQALQDEVYRLKYDYVGVQGAGHLDAIKRRSQ
jgi:peptidoglycan-N-acetylglucosamine deacetylase